MRPYIGINGQYPNPPIVGTLGDTIKINVVNNLGNQSTSLHFHGMFQQGTNFEDGPVGVTQCPIPPGQSFVYQFRLNQTGTFWYHAHHGGSYIGKKILGFTSTQYCLLTNVQMDFAGLSSSRIRARRTKQTPSSP